MEKKTSSVYLDYAAAEPPIPSVKEYVRSGVEMFFNPSSIYQRGRYAWQLIEAVREKIAKTINADPEEIIFTSGCSESNALAITGSRDNNTVDYVVATEIEHSSILESPYLYQVKIAVDEKGFVDQDHLEKMCRELRGDTLFCIQHANNEIGVIQNVEGLSKIIHDNKHLLLVDAAQTFGKLPIDVKKMNIDFLSASAGKCGGIRGAGFLYVRKGLNISPVIFGTQESHRRGGTYNDLAIVAFGKAIDGFDFRKQTVIRSKRNYLIEELLKLKGIALVGKRADRLPNNVFITIKDLDIDSQQLVSLLDMYGFMVSAGSACHAGESQISHVLKALGYDDETARTCLRISIGDETTVQELNLFIESLKVIMKMHKIKREKK